MSDAGISERLFVSFWSDVAKCFDGCDVYEDGPCRVVYSGTPIIFLNNIVLGAGTEGPDTFESAVKAALRIAEGKGLPWLLATHDDWRPPSADQFLHSTGFSPAIRLTYMTAGSLAPSRRPVPELEMRRVRNAQDSLELARINAVAYGMPAETAGGLTATSLWLPPNNAFLGRTGGRAVACAGTLLEEGLRYVGWVATLPEEQRRGYAEAVMRHTLDCALAETGVQSMALHATDAGKPVYQAMGFQARAGMTLYALGGH